MWVNADDHGRLCGDPEEIKYTCCPNIDHITKSDVPGLLRELVDNDLILCYKTSKSAAIQILDWWDPHRSPQWAWPSDYQPPEGWQDHLRYKKDAKTVLTLNWPVSGEEINGTQVSKDNSSGERLGEDIDGSQVSKDNSSGERSGEKPRKSPSFPHTPIPTPIKRNGKGGRRGRGRGNSPEDSGENPHLRHLVLTEQDKGIYETLKENYCMRWGHVRAKNPDEIIPRQLKAKDEAQLRDLAIELSGAGGCSADKIKQAFDEAAGQRKYSVSYVRAVLLDWLGIERVHAT
jgi:hypothetical protein